MGVVLDQSMTLADALESASTHHLQGRYADAMALYEAVLEREPDNAQARMNLGMLLLLHGNFEDGWPAFKWRRHAQPNQLPLWDGSELNGKGVLIRGEQGAGDNIQFLRYLPFVAARGGRASVLTLPGMKRLLGSMDSGIEILEPGDQASDLHVEVPVMDLPGLAGTSIDSIPAPVPYLYAEPALQEAWEGRLGPAAGRRIGLCWQGNPEKPRDELRSIALNRFLPLFARPGIQWFGLQVGAGEDQVPELDGNADFTHLGPHLGAGPDKFIEAAAVIATLDLVITVDTAIAHLAGALGRPVWILLPKIPDWRWLLERQDSPWYPTARLFRQVTAGDWNAPLDAMADELNA